MVVIRITNDTSTLNGSLAQLGETLASNITAKGVSASASDGLTTLANKVLQISGGGGGSTVLFEDSGVTGTKNDDFLCTKTSGNYTLTTDSTGTTFVCTGSDGFYIPNIDLHSYSDLEITWTFTYGTRYACHLSLLNSSKSYSNNMRWHNTGTSTPTTSWYIPSGQTSISHTLTSGDEMKLTLSNGTWSLYCEDELIGTATPNYDVYYIGLTSADGNRPFGYKDLVIKDNNGGGSDCSQYTTQINNAITYINGSGS